MQSLKKGAYDFIQKPLDLNRVLVTLRNVLEREALVETTKVLTKKPTASNPITSWAHLTPSRRF